MGHREGTHAEGTFTGLGGVPIYHQHWLPEGATRAVLLIAHGYGEHSGRYGNVVGYFAPRGYALYALDHRGHGKSGGERVHVDHFNDYLADLKTYFDIVRAAQPGAPIFLLGHSMGAAIATAYAARFQHELTGLIISGGGIASSDPPTPMPRIDLSTSLSTDPAVGEAYRNDPLVFHGTPPAGRTQAMAEMRSELPLLARKIALPIVIMAGADSPLGDGPRSRALYDVVASADKTLLLYDGLLHEIFNEPSHEDVLGDLAQWLDEILAAAAHERAG